MHATRSNPLFQDLTHAVIGLILGAACALIGLLAAASGAHAAGLMSPSDASLPALAIKHHQVRVVIEDGYAVTTIEQVFHNPHATDLEAVYSFPVPDQASVSEFTYWIDGQPVRGEVLPKRQARQVYQEEKAAGREAGLTEQDSHKTFEVSVWPVRAGQDVRIRLGYIQPTAIDTGIGRYVYPLEDGGVDEQKLAPCSGSTDTARPGRCGARGARDPAAHEAPARGHRAPSRSGESLTHASRRSSVRRRR